MSALAKILIFAERDDVFEPLQIVVIPAIMFLACLVYGG
jgi:hypothetical protein